MLPEKINTVLSVNIICVAKSFTRHGIGHNFIEYATKEAKKQNYQGLIADTTAIKSQQVFFK